MNRVSYLLIGLNEGASIKQLIYIWRTSCTSNQKVIQLDLEPNERQQPDVSSEIEHLQSTGLPSGPSEGDLIIN